MRKVKEAIVKTSIITYRKADVSEEDIHGFYNILKEDSSLLVEHLSNLGAFVITFNSMDRMAGRKLGAALITANISQVMDRKR